MGYFVRRRCILRLYDKGGLKLNKELVIFLIAEIILYFLGATFGLFRPLFFVGALLCAIGGFKWAVHEDASFLWKFVFGCTIVGTALSLIGMVVGFFRH